jgi:hypothetical protein
MAIKFTEPHLKIPIQEIGIFHTKDTWNGNIWNQRGSFIKPPVTGRNVTEGYGVMEPAARRCPTLGFERLVIY